jgi:hypothetical protein
LREEVPVAASAREAGDQADQRENLPPLAGALYGAVDIRIAKVTAKAMLRPFIGDLPDVREALMMISSRSK